jgi:hypothetical protein
VIRKLTVGSCTYLKEIKVRVSECPLQYIYFKALRDLQKRQALVYIVILYQVFLSCD